MAKKQSKVVDSNSLMINEEVLRDKIYSIRGQKVMLDYDLAEIYGYTTSAFNQQVKNNIEKFEGEDFMFQLTDSDITGLSISKKLISMQTKGTKGGRAKMPYAFTEQGIYMLMTVLRGEEGFVVGYNVVGDFKGCDCDLVVYKDVVAGDFSGKVETGEGVINAMFMGEVGEEIEFAHGGRIVDYIKIAAHHERTGHLSREVCDFMHYFDRDIITHRVSEPVTMIIQYRESVLQSN